MPGAWKSGLGGRVWVGSRPQELPAKSWIVGVAQIESLVKPG